MYVVQIGRNRPICPCLNLIREQRAAIHDEVYQRAAVSNCLTSGGKMVRAGRNAKEILIPKIEVTGLGDYTRNVGYKTAA